MTTCDDTAAPCASCCAADLPVNPFVALRVAFGMLLGEDDFRTLMGNSRGKQMLHSAWLHGSGVVWGMRARLDGEFLLRVSPGLALDGHGRELHAETSWCLDLRDWLTRNQHTADSANEGDTKVIHTRLLAEFSCRPSNLVPTLADPCDVTRKRDDYSRVLETVHFTLSADPVEPVPVPYRRVRALLGLGEADTEVDSASCLPPEQRAAELLHKLRVLAAADSAELAPPSAEEPFPVTELNAPVLLAEVAITVRVADGAMTIVKVDLRPEVRTTLLPTWLIQELTCGLAPGLLGPDTQPDAGGPRLDPGSLKWSANGDQLTFEVTAALNPRSLRRAVRVTSLSADRGWVDEDIDAVRVDEESGTHVTVELAGRLSNELVRLTVRGTGPEPAFGVHPAVPLAGVRGGPPGSRHDGHDAALTFTFGRTQA
ncbi:hypothetical protein GCM10010174_19580 [Kutzneria viridogrisea]|uniref:Uncharacterized protein n=1 Tax=Kutzneria viridogrisea TaxID=47990 RepID=A0ABR6B7Z2_9PSEU|nr:hypothetical protein [Kutzneria viridogrisea]